MENTWEGKTVESAVEVALKDLKCSKDNVEIEILQEPIKGIFGITRAAKVKVIKKNPKTENILTDASAPASAKEERIITEEVILHGVKILDNILKLMGIDNSKVIPRQEAGSVILDLKSDAEGLLIGRHGQTREALQYIVERIANQEQKDRTKYIIDIGGYLGRHREMLINLAQRAEEKVKSQQKEEHLPVMNAFDRRIIHLHLKDHQDVITFSQGEGGYRHIVIGLKNGEIQEQQK